MSGASEFRIAVLISGGGTTLQNLLEYRQRGELKAEIALVISSSASARGLEFAHAAGLSTHVCPKPQGTSDQAYSDAVFGPCRDAKVDLVVMGGFLKHVMIPDDFEHRVINIHPSLIPAFCGKGMYGHRVHQAVLDFGAKVSGCTVHFVDNEYDHGPIIAQRCVSVLPGDTPDELQQRVFRQECWLYPEVINRLASGEIAVEGRQAYVRPVEE